MGKKKKTKAEKVVYYDDNSTIVDMSQVPGMGGKKPPQQPRRKSTFSEKWRTYWSAVRMMLLPTLIAIIAISIVFLVIMLVT